MAIVKISPARESIQCRAGQSGRFQFNISNATSKDVRFSAETKGSDGNIDWLSVDGDSERTLSASATSTLEVIASPPITLIKMEEGNKRFNFKLRVNDTENTSDMVDSETVSVEVIPVPPPPKKFPWWIVILAVTGVVITGAAIWHYSK